MKQTLPVIRNIKHGEIKSRITCELVGEMDTGEKVWQDENGKQYLRVKLGRCYAFIPI